MAPKGVGFRTAGEDEAARSRTANASKSGPGPGDYRVSSGFGAQVEGGKASVSAFSIGHARKGDGQRAGTTDKYYDSPSAFGSQRASGKSSGAAFSMSGRAAPSPGRGEPSPGPGHYAAVKAGEAYSDTTRFGGQSIAKQSENWARQLGRSSSSSRDIDFAHRY